MCLLGALLGMTQVVPQQQMGLLGAHLGKQTRLQRLLILQRQQRREMGVLPQGLPLDLMPTEGNLEAQITASDAPCSFSGEPLRQDACSNDLFDQSTVPGPSAGCSSSIQSDSPV